MWKQSKKQLANDSQIGRSVPPCATAATPPATPGCSPHPNVLVPRKAAVDAVVCLLLVAAVFAVFGQTAGFSFINLDDHEYVCENSHVLGGLNTSDIAWAFTHSDPGGYWDPLTLISLMADVELARPKHGSLDLTYLAGRMHMVNIILHAANVALLFLLLRSATATVWRSALVAAVFAVHPLHVESVAWITERKDVLSGFFGLVAIAAYIWYSRQPSFLRWLCVTSALALGLMCKPMLVTWPLVLLLLDYWPLKRVALPGRREKPRGAGEPAAVPSQPHCNSRLAPQYPLRWLLLEKAPLVPFVAASALVTILLERTNGAVVTLDAVPISERIVRAAALYVDYIGKTFWPVNLVAGLSRKAAGHLLAPAGGGRNAGADYRVRRMVRAARHAMAGRGLALVSSHAFCRRSGWCKLARK